MKRTTLLTRLKPEFLEGLKANEDEYFNTVEDLYIKLGKFYFYGYLAVDDVKALFIMSNVGTVRTYERTSKDWMWGTDIFDEQDSVA